MVRIHITGTGLTQHHWILSAFSYFIRSCSSDTFLGSYVADTVELIVLWHCMVKFIVGYLVSSSTTLDT